MDSKYPARPLSRAGTIATAGGTAGGNALSVQTGNSGDRSATATPTKIQRTPSTATAHARAGAGLNASASQTRLPFGVAPPPVATGAAAAFDGYELSTCCDRDRS